MHDASRRLLLAGRGAASAPGCLRHEREPALDSEASDSDAGSGAGSGSGSASPSRRRGRLRGLAGEQLADREHARASRGVRALGDAVHARLPQETRGERAEVPSRVAASEPDSRSDESSPKALLRRRPSARTRVDATAPRAPGLRRSARRGMTSISNARAGAPNGRGARCASAYSNSDAEFDSAHPPIASSSFRSKDAFLAFLV